MAPYPLAVGVEDVRAVAVYQHAVRIQLVEGIASDVRALIDQIDLMSGVGQRASDGTAGETSADDQGGGRVVHLERCEVSRIRSVCTGS